MIVRHYSEVKWDKVRWPNFQPAELSCHHCGEMYYDEADYDAIQFLRHTVGRGVTLNSAHRCTLHNAREGGKPGSWHKKNAFDIALSGHDPANLLIAARAAGFTGFGFYGTFLHVDRGPSRWWKTNSGEKVWGSLIQSLAG